MESALLSVSRVRVRHAAEEGDSKAKKLSVLLERRDDLLHAVATTNHVFGLVTFACASLLVVNAMGRWGWLVCFGIILPLFLVLLELLPKQLYAQRPLKSLRICVGLLSVVNKLTLPWRTLAGRLKPKAFDLLPPESDSKGLDDLIKTIKLHQLLPESCEHMMENYARLQKSPVDTYMLPLRQLTAIPPDLQLSQLIIVNKEQRAPWYVVLADSGNLLGWLDAQGLPSHPNPDKVVRQFLRPVSHVQRTDSALDCLRHLRKRGEFLTAVHNEQHQVIGVITQQRLLEELFSTRTDRS